MNNSDPTLREIRAAWENEPRINLHRHPIQLGLNDDAIVLDGEVETVAAKRLALSWARSVNGSRVIVDRLRVLPAARKGDGAVRDAVTQNLLGEPALSPCAVRVRVKGQWRTLRDAGPAPDGAIEVEVEDGIVRLRGRVGSLSHKRLAGVLAWWAPGCCDVVNDLEVVPAEEDNDGEIADALRLVLEKDPLVHADQIRITVYRCTVLLQGLLATEEEKKMAEQDAWYVCGVTEVVNNIEVRM